jgi:hypothetical protein
MQDRVICEGCGKKLQDGATICLHCGWDQTAAIAQPEPPSLLEYIRSGGWRLLLYGVIILLPVLGFMRLRTTGPGSDLPTTLRWMAFGDGGRAAELETIHRMHEIGSATARYALREMELPPFEGEWEEVLARSATARVRGWMPLVFFGADTQMAPASVRQLYEVRALDGWGRPYRITTRKILRGVASLDESIVVSDFEKGLQATFFTVDFPDLENGEWVRLLVESAGRDGEFDTDDDLRMVSYLRIGHVFRLLYDANQTRIEVERAYTIGRHWFRIEGSQYDLIDARLLAEYRLTSIH